MKNRILCLFIMALGIVSNVWGQSSFLERIETLKKSMVTVRAFSRNVSGQPSENKLGTSLSEKTAAGVIIDPSGIIITNYHTVYLANKMSVRLHDGTSMGATILKLLPAYDLALISIEPPFPLIPIGFADSNNIKLGDEIYHIGHSFLLDNTISRGQIKGIGKKNTIDGNHLNDVELIQISINLYKGDSGGPIINREGRLLGMINAKNFKKDKVSYAIPSNKIKNFYLFSEK